MNFEMIINKYTFLNHHKINNQNSAQLNFYLITSTLKKKIIHRTI